MQIIKNIGLIDRFYRATFGIICLLAAFFWFGGLLGTFLYFLAFILLATSISGFCLVYYILNLSTYLRLQDESYGYSKKVFSLILITLIILGTLGSYILTKRNFLNEFNEVNEDYKEVLISSVQANRDEAIGDYNKLSRDYTAFYEKYTSYHPYIIRGDKEFNKDLEKINFIIRDTAHKINYGNLTAGYTSLEAIRPLINNIRIRNKLQSDKVAFSDLYFSIELLAEASEAQDLQEITKAYTLANEKLKNIESFKNNSQIQLMRANLESINTLAKKNDLQKLPSRVSQLKSIYLQVYLGEG